MGLLDHRKDWHFSVRATDEQCFQAFERAMSTPGFKVRAVKWSIDRDNVPVVPGGSPWSASIATYEGRAGLASVLTILVGRRAQEVEQGAMGSQIIFAVNPQSPGGRTECSMWLKRYGTQFGFIADAGYIRSYMNDVEQQLRTLDPGLTVDRG